jgi:RNA polymerase sigma-70 factor (ECF subfamily)
MDSASEPPTSSSLLARLGHSPTDQQAWSAFVARYGPKIHGWCRRWNLPDADAEDVTQYVLVRLARKMETFAYDPSRSFRAWLKTLTHHAWRDYVDSRERAGRGSADATVEEILHRVEARDDLTSRLSEEYDHELLEEAMARVRLRVEPRTWEAFRLTALEGLSGSVAAERLSIPVMTAFKHKNRVQKMIQETVRQLNGPAEEEA